MSVRCACSERARALSGESNTGTSPLPRVRASPGAFCPNCARQNSGPGLGTARQNERRAAFIEAAGVHSGLRLAYSEHKTSQKTTVSNIVPSVWMILADITRSMSFSRCLFGSSFPTCGFGRGKVWRCEQAASRRPYAQRCVGLLPACAARSGTDVRHFSLLGGGRILLQHLLIVRLRQLAHPLHRLLVLARVLLQGEPRADSATTLARGCAA